MSELKNIEGLTEEEFLKTYNPGDYERPSVTTDILIIGMDKNYLTPKLLLIKRGNHPYLNCWALPGGFVGPNETAYQAAARELKEETGLENIYLEQGYTFTKPGRDPRMWVMSISYMALVPKLDEVSGNDDAEDAAWFDVLFQDDILYLSNTEKNIRIGYRLTKQTFSNGVIQYDNYVPEHIGKTEKLAFDHVEIVLETLTKLRREFAYTDKAFCLANKTFTIPELQRIYEAVLGHPLYKTSFRDSIKGKIKETGNKKKSAFDGGNMSKEYTYYKE